MSDSLSGSTGYEGDYNTSLASFHTFCACIVFDFDELAFSFIVILCHDDPRAWSVPVTNFGASGVLTVVGVGDVVYRKVDSGYSGANNALDRSEDGMSVFSPPFFGFAVGTDWRHLTNSVLDRVHNPGLVLRRVLR